MRGSTVILTYDPASESIGLQKKINGELLPLMETTGRVARVERSSVGPCKPPQCRQRRPGMAVPNYTAKPPTAASEDASTVPPAAAKRDGPQLQSRQRRPSEPTQAETQAARRDGPQTPCRQRRPGKTAPNSVPPVAARRDGPQLRAACGGQARWPPNAEPPELSESKSRPNIFSGLSSFAAALPPIAVAGVHGMTSSRSCSFTANLK